MRWLFLASLLWAFSFGLIKRYLTGLDPWWVASVRLVLSAVAFAPWWRRWSATGVERGWALALGAVQFGLMYVCYLSAYRYLAAWQVALWTVFTPVFVVLIVQLRRRRFRMAAWLAAVVAVAGAVLAQGRWPAGDTLRGVMLVQASNLAFAAGQLLYASLARRTGARTAAAEAGLVGWMSLGGAVLPAAMALILQRPLALELVPAAVPVLLYLGLVPTALGFWSWNRGAARVAPSRLAVANNLKIPLAVVVAWTVFGEAARYPQALVGLAVILGALVWLNDENPGS